MSVWRRFRRKGIGIVDLCAKCKKMACPRRRKMSKRRRECHAGMTLFEEYCKAEKKKPYWFREGRKSRKRYLKLMREIDQ